MSESLQTVLCSFGFHDWLFANVIAKMPEDQGAFRAHRATNEFRQIAAHLLVSRHGLAGLLEMRPAALPCDDLGTGTEAGFKSVKCFPALRTMGDHWAQLGGLFRRNLLSVPPSVLSRPCPFPLPGNKSSSLQDLVWMNVTHEGYHLGQLGLILKALTRKSLVIEK